MNFPVEVFEKLERAKINLGQNKKELSLEEVLDQALESLLDKKDSVSKAERSLNRENKKKLEIKNKVQTSSNSNLKKSKILETCDIEKKENC